MQILRHKLAKLYFAENTVFIVGPPLSLFKKMDKSRRDPNFVIGELSISIRASYTFQKTPDGSAQVCYTGPEKIGNLERAFITGLVLEAPSANRPFQKINP